MAITKMSIRQLIKYFSEKGLFPHGKVLTLSRYDIRFDKGFVNHICQNAGWKSPFATNDDDFLNDEILFNALGFEHLDSMDNSDYEYATITHDLNNAGIPKDLMGKYDYIIDAGTIEHVFNFQNVMENIFKMLKAGGTFFFDQPTFFNFNHGYYNFSPCLFYEYFKANKWTINSIVPYSVKEGFTYVADPVVNDVFGYMPMIENSENLVWGAVTKRQNTTFDVVPQQNAYSNEWKQSRSTANSLFETADNNTVYVYGTGNYAGKKLSMLPVRYRQKIAGLVSADKNEIGQKFFGYEVYPIEAIPAGSVVLIAVGNQFYDIVYSRIKHLSNTIIRFV